MIKINEIHKSNSDQNNQNTSISLTLNFSEPAKKVFLWSSGILLVSYSVPRTLDEFSSLLQSENIYKPLPNENISPSISTNDENKTIFYLCVTLNMKEPLH